MTYEQAVNVALAALDAERKRVAVDANLYAQGLCTTPHARAAFERRRELETARDVLGQKRMKV